MPVVNIGLERTRDRIIGSGDKNTVVDSIGFGTDNTAENAADDQLGDNAGSSSWKTSGDVTQTTGGDGTSDPWWQFEATWGTGEFNVTIFEIGTSAGSLTGTDPAANNGTNLYTRKRIGGATGIGKTTDIELVGRVKVTY